ncbi:cbb3-type cytochrome c oxidase subunit 3 [Iodobacter sp. HSC-16F04]|uniref:Cbb3-type cytochrome c oxidase subunit 3 n=1 Tax=Iodobacter violaceini TaxID=3044271 RepID=A0ABX0KSE3_9NEIS|nr:cbb3-type cytochrome c oxidase subunit 3 [Iodobacter violacea]NHQ87580.1 cbb3-type cytochrome c oxidase subunit 3 [Iodobacter violacea]
MEMLNDLRVLSTVVSFICFVGILVWACSKNSKASFDEAAQLPFLDDDLPSSNKTS